MCEYDVRMNTDTTYAPIRKAGPATFDAVVAVLTDAFAADPLAEWLFPEPSDRARLQAGFYRSFLEHPGAEVELVGYRYGAAVWLTMDPEQVLASEEPDQAADPATARLRAVGEALATRHPVGEPHRYLAVMGVAAAKQGGGFGSALLRAGLERSDRDGVGTYLEAGSPGSRALYLRHGFTDLGAPVRLADAPALYPMWRPAAEAKTNR
jgi:GNAT superfamily N-acetyltransferase